MKHPSSLIALTVLFPVAAFALTAQDVDNVSRYKDAKSFSVAEKAGISLLTSREAVSGNPDGSFAARRTLNRAEFLKIAMKASGKSDLKIGYATDCFPDVPKDAWYNEYVCKAKMLNVVTGNEQAGVSEDKWKFEPAREVNYAEAVKMLVELYQYDLPEPADNERWAWYTGYIKAAEEHGVALPGNMEAGHLLTRGQMARLAAAFVAESEGSLSAYRDAEKGLMPSSSSSVSSVSSSASSASSATSASSVSSSSSTSSSSSASSLFPAKSQFLILGETSKPIASQTVSASSEGLTVRGAEVKLRAKSDSIEALYLVDQTGKTMATLAKDAFDSTDKTWKGTVTMTGSVTVGANTSKTFGITAKLKARNAGSRSEELIEVATLTFQLEMASTGQMVSMPFSTGFPKHQTAQGHFTSVTNVLGEKGVLKTGVSQLLGSFALAGQTVPDTRLQVTSIEFEVEKDGVAVTQWQLGASDSTLRYGCSASNTTVSCLVIPSELGVIYPLPRTLHLYGDVTVDQGAQKPFLQVSLNQAGTIGVNGAIRWTDEIGQFNWVELNTPIVKGTRWE